MRRKDFGYDLGNRFLSSNEWENQLYRIENTKFKKGKNWHFGNWTTEGCRVVNYTETETHCACEVRLSPKKSP